MLGSPTFHIRRTNPNRPMVEFFNTLVNPYSIS